MNLRNGIRNFQAQPPSYNRKYIWENIRADYRRGGMREAWRMKKAFWTPFGRNTGSRAYFLHYRETMLAQKRGEAWRGLTISTTYHGYVGLRGKGWNNEYPINNTRFCTWLKLRFWWTLPRPWRYFQACDCYKFSGPPETWESWYDGKPCGGNRSRYGCRYS